MSAVYIDNFRGFQDTFITFKRATFFVGENSTGKTSVLSLLALINSFDFWYRFSFNSEFVELGSFSDIASGPKSTFCIATIRGWLESDRERQCSWIRARFEDIDDVPSLCELSLKNDTGAIYIRYYQNHLAYSFSREDVSPSAMADTAKFERWVKSPFPGDLVRLEFGDLERHQRTAFYLTHLAEQDLRSKDKEASYRMPTLFHTPNDSFCWISPIRAKPKRTYDSYRTTYSPEGDHVPYVLNSVLSHDENKTNREALQDKLESFGKLSELFQKIKPVRFGRRKTAPFEITVRLAGHSRRISSVGYGISQVLPIVVETALPRNRMLYLVQQPEVHLHPKAQAALGNLFFDLTLKGQHFFALETHSDFLIDRFRILQAEKTKSDELLAQVLFFERCENGNKVTAIAIDAQGRYAEEQPASFREFFIKEQMNILGL